MTVVNNWLCGRLRKTTDLDEEFAPQVVQVPPINVFLKKIKIKNEVSMVVTN